MADTPPTFEPPAPFGAAAPASPPTEAPDPGIPSDEDDVEEAPLPSTAAAVLAGLVVGFGVVLTTIGVIASWKVWQAFGEPEDNGLGAVADTDYLDLQRWVTVTQPLSLVALGLLIVVAGFVLRRLDQIVARR